MTGSVSSVYAWTWPPLLFDTGLLLAGRVLWWLSTRNAAQRRRIEGDFALWTRELKSKDFV